MARFRRWRGVAALSMLLLTVGVILAWAPSAQAANGGGTCSACIQNCYDWFIGFYCCLDHHDGAGSCEGWYGGGRCIMAGTGCIVVVVRP